MKKKQVMCVQITIPFSNVHIFIYYTYNTYTTLRKGKKET